jgi:hypothetical protein
MAELSREYLEEALSAARKLRDDGILAGWQYALIHQAAMPASGGRAAANRRAAESAPDEITTMTDDELSALQQKLLAEVARRAKPDAAAETETTKKSVVFIEASVTKEDAEKRVPIAGAVLEFFKKEYLAPLGDEFNVDGGMARLFYVSPDAIEKATAEEWLEKMRSSQVLAGDAGTIVALGMPAKEWLGDMASFSLPHPAIINARGDSRGELGRKLRQIKKQIGSGGETVHPREIPITKEDQEKQIVYGVVLDPYEVDAHSDWTPPADVEATAHNWVLKSRVVGLQHKKPSTSSMVESFVKEYPTPQDRAKAFAGEPHSAYETQYGTTTIHSGTWVLGVKLSDQDWAAHKRGELNAFSVGGFGVKTPMSRSAMPVVHFIKQ